MLLFSDPENENRWGECKEAEFNLHYLIYIIYPDKDNKYMEDSCCIDTESSCFEELDRSCAEDYFDIHLVQKAFSCL